MSTGNIIGGIIGAVIGFYAGGNVAAGWAIGSALGGVVDPDRIDGPHLNDRSVQVSTQGVAIPIIYGGVSGSGNVIDADDLQEHDVDGGKGGPSVTQHTYSWTGAILIGEAPRGRTIKGIRRIWADAKLVFDASAEADMQTQLASVVFAGYFTFYGGSETQLPDPTLEAKYGVGNVCAYLGCCYVVFKDLPVQDYGNRLPQFRFETSDELTEVAVGGDFTYEPLRLNPWNADNSAQPSHSQGATRYVSGNLYDGNDYDTAKTALYSFYGYRSSVYLGFWSSLSNIASYFPAGANQSVNGINGEGWGSPKQLTGGYNYVTPDFTIVDFFPYPDPYPPVGQTGRVIEQLGIVPWGGGHLDTYLMATAQIGYPGGVLIGVFEHGKGDVPWSLSGADGGPNVGVNLGNYPPGPDGNIPNYRGFFTAVMTSERVPSPPPSVPGCMPGDPCIQITAQMPGHPEFCINCAGEITPNQAISYEVITGTFKQLAAVEYRAGVVYQNGVGPVLLPSDPNYDNATFWSEQRAAAIVAGTLRSDVTSPVVVTQIAKGTHGTYARLQAAEANTTLDLIVEDICLRAGMPAQSFDVTALEGIEVQGYAIARQMPGRTAIDPLQTTFWWDFVESGRQLKAVLRGGAAAMSVPVDELGATEGDESPIAVLPNRGQEAELPATVEVSYSARATGYETATQRARRTTTGSKQQINVEVAVVMTDQRAVDVAAVLMYTNWTARTTREWATTRKYSALEPTDLVRLSDGEFDYFVRITERTEDGPVIRWKGVDDKPASYAPNGTPAASGTIVGGTKYDGPMKLELIDCAPLRDDDDDAGAYAAVGGFLPGWPGGAAYKSVDGGATYSRVKSMSNKATIGYAASVLGDWTGGNLVDELNSVQVRMHYGELVSITQSSLLNDGNFAILGDELFQFKRAELVGTGLYRLTGLLRGRKGTEQAMATHSVDERFILLNLSTIYRVDGSLGELNVPEIWKGVTTGQTLDEAFEVAFTNTGKALKPFAPAHLNAVDIGGGQRRVTWVRRTRIGAKWRDGVDVPLGETIESYVVEVLTGSNLNSTATTSATTLDVTATSGDTVRVYQLSSTVGRGLPAIKQL